MRTALASANVNQAKGNFDGPRAGLHDRRQRSAPGRARSTGRSSSPIATARRCASRTSRRSSTASRTRSSAAWVERRRRRSILNVQRQPGANIIDVVDAVKAPAAAAHGVAAARRSTSACSATARRPSARRCKDVQFELVLTIVARRAGDLPVPAQPLRRPSSRASPCRCRWSAPSRVMYLLGYSLNNLSLMALTISTGFVVDDAIVMIENIARYIEEGDRRCRRRSRARQQIGFTIVSLTVSLIAVLIPLLFMGGHRRPSVPRVRGHARGHDHRLRVRVAHADADDVRADSPAPAGSGAGQAVSLVGAVLRTGDRALRPDAARGCCGTRARRCWWRSGTLGADRSISTTSCRRASSRCRTPASSSGCREAPQTSRSARCPERQQQLAEVILEDPAVESLSSFIGADGVNTTMNSGRIQINLEAARGSARRCPRST